ncbi:MAG: hypothetical protein DSZ29_06895 [Aquificaceae bacterium]|nr:MAG: hypothetical protein DSZ29_06895 [Aquificaceae bacterium]
MKKLKTSHIVKNIFYGLLLLVSASVFVVFANTKEISPIVNTSDLPVCNIETLSSLGDESLL